MIRLKALCTLAILCLFLTSYGQVPAFPGAEGYGKYTSGGRAGSVYEVTNLNNEGPGSLRDAVSQSNRTVVFRVSGNIELKSELVILGNNLTIAGQTAPGDGICVRDYPTKIAANNVIIRFLRFRLGDRHDLKSDALHMNKQENVIIDHCTMSWGVDECFSAYGNNNVTVQYCMIGEGLNLKGHSMGGLWGGYSTYHHNLVHTNNTRHPKYAYTYDEDITDSRNNVIYNWGYNSAYTSPTGRVNLVNNYYKSGPATGAAIRDRIIQAEPTKRMYITGNYVDGFPEITADNWNGGVDPLNGGRPIRHDSPFVVPNPLPEHSAEEAYLEIIAHAGASFPARDDADQRAIKNLVQGAGKIVVRQGDVGGFPILRSLPAPEDNDHDGMPDEWEETMGLDKNDPADRNGDLNGNGYTNLEDYLNNLPEADDSMPKPGFFKAEALSEHLVNLSWFDLNSDERGFVIERSTDSSGFSLLYTTPADTGYFKDESVEPLTIYYYRIRSYSETDESEWVYTPGVKTFAADEKPGQTVLLAPVNQLTEVPITGVTLEWEGGDYTLSYMVYLGTDRDALIQRDSGLINTQYKSGTLDFGSDYFWRIDAVNANGVTAGEIRTFTTLEAAEPGLILYWPFLEEDGNVVFDSTENHNDGTLKNVSELLRGEGPFGKSVSLGNSGPAGHISVPDNLSISFDDDPFSIAFWMRLSEVSDSSVYIFHKGSFNSSSGTERNGRWLGLEMRSGSFRFSIDDNDNKTVVGGSTNSFVSGEWVHVAVVRDTYKGTLYLYKNGSVVTTSSDKTGAIGVDMPLMIGNSDHMYPQFYGGDSDENSPYRGDLAEFVICSHPLSREEVTNLYKHNRVPTLGPAVNIQAAEQNGRLKVYPNPFNEEVCVEYEAGSHSQIILEVYNMQGQLLSSQLEDINSPGRCLIHLNEGHQFLLVLKSPAGEILDSEILIRE